MNDLDRRVQLGEESVWREVTNRWLYDAEFHARVETAVNMALTQTRNRSTRTIVREAVALAIVLEGRVTPEAYGERRG